MAMTERTVSGSESAPSAATDGTALGGMSRVWWLVKSLNTITSYTQSLYLYDGNSANPAWVQIQETVQAGKTTTDANFYDLPDNSVAAPRWTRYFIRISSLVGTSLVVGHEGAPGAAI